jgi:hypothetical protein
MNSILFLAVRAGHVLLAALWIGSSVFLALLLEPAIEAPGASGGEVMMGMSRRGLTAYMSVLGGTTVVTGFYLLWRFAGSFSALPATHAGIAFGIGGTAGVLAGVIGGGVVGRSATRVTQLMQQAAGVTGTAKAEILQRAAPLRQRMQIGTRVVIALQAVALVLMAVGHYV